LKAASKPVSASATNPDLETAGSRLRSACEAHSPNNERTREAAVPTWSLVDARGKKGLADRALRSRLISLSFDIFSRPTITASARNANDGRCREIVDRSSRNLGSRQNRPDPAPIDDRTRFKPSEAGGLADWMRATRRSPTGWGSGGARKERTLKCTRCSGSGNEGPRAPERVQVSHSTFAWQVAIAC
jgi:hypothetical protein